MNKIRKNFLGIIIKLSRMKILRLSDKLYLKILYEYRMNEKIDFDNPKTFNEKLQWLKLYDRRPEYTKMVDKYEAKKYVASIIGEQYIIPTIGIYDNFDDIDFSKLPNQFVIKCTHDSGGLSICKDKKNFDIDAAKKKINKSLKRNYYYMGREWPYKDVKPRIIIEKYMEDNIDKDIRDYKFFSFNGEPKFCYVCTDRHKDGLKTTFFDLDWKKLPFERNYPSSNEKIEKPKNFDKMIEFTKILTKNIPFLRMDWYEVNGELYFGEFTFFPTGGFSKFNPEEWNYKIGQMIDLSNVKINNKYRK